jgi:hypothetical protein
MSKSDDIKEGYRRGKSGSSDSTGWFDTPTDQRARDQAFREGAIDRERERIEREAESERERNARDRERELEDRARERDEARESREKELLEEQERIEEEAAERQEEILAEHRDELRELQEERERAERQRLDRYEDITKNEATLRAMARLETGGQLHSAELFDEAIQMYAEAMRLNPALLEPHWFMAQCLRSLNRIDDARAEFIKFLKLLGLHRDASIVKWWMGTLHTLVTHYASDDEIQAAVTKSFALVLPHFRASAIGLVSYLREAGKPEAASQLLTIISETAEADARSLPLVDKLRESGGTDAAAALVSRIARSAPPTPESLRLLPVLCEWKLKNDALEMLARIRKGVKEISDQIVLAAGEMNTHWVLSHELVATPVAECFREIQWADRFKAKTGIEKLQEGRGGAVLFGPEVYGAIVRNLEARFGDWSHDIDQALRKQSQADALKAHNSRAEYPVKRFEDAPRNVKRDADTRVSELWKQELQLWSSITTALSRPEAPVQPDIAATDAKWGSIGLIAAAVIAVLFLALVGFVVMQMQQNGGTRQVPAISPTQTAPQAISAPPSTAENTPRGPDVGQGLQSVESPPMVPMLFEAEAAELAGSARQSRENAGYSGDGYVGYGDYGSGATTTFRVTVAAGGDYAVSLRYANAIGRVMTLTLYVNGARIGRVAMPPLLNWTTWGDQVQTVRLAPGTNTIAYRYDQGDTGNVNLDYVRIERTSSRPVLAPVLAPAPVPAPEPEPVPRPSPSPNLQSAIPPDLMFTVVHRHGIGGLSDAQVRQYLNGSNAIGGPNYCKGDITVTADGFSFRTMVTSDDRRDDVRGSYSDIKKVERKEPGHFRLETDKHGNWDFFADPSVVEQIERRLLSRSNLFRR